MSLLVWQLITSSTHAGAIWRTLQTKHIQIHRQIETYTELASASAGEVFIRDVVLLTPATATDALAFTNNHCVRRTVRQVENPFSTTWHRPIRCHPHWSLVHSAMDPTGGSTGVHDSANQPVVASLITGQYDTWQGALVYRATTRK